MTAQPRQSVRAPSTPEAAEAQRSCNQGVAAACGALGRMLTAGEPHDAELERGMVLLELACGQDDPPSCAALGGIYARQARNNASARSRAQEMLSRACERSAANACTKLGRLFGTREAAGDTFRRACELGDPEGCEAFAFFEEEQLDRRRQQERH